MLFKIQPEKYLHSKTQRVQLLRVNPWALGGLWGTGLRLVTLLSPIEHLIVSLSYFCCLSHKQNYLYKIDLYAPPLVSFFPLNKNLQYLLAVLLKNDVLGGLYSDMAY